jgi:hypothetical protein
VKYPGQKFCIFRGFEEKDMDNLGDPGKSGGCTPKQFWQQFSYKNLITRISDIPAMRMRFVTRAAVSWLRRVKRLEANP